MIAIDYIDVYNFLGGGMMLFKKKKTEPKPRVVSSHEYIQSNTYRGYKRQKLSSYGYQPALEGISALSGLDLTGANIRLDYINDEYKCVQVYVGPHLAGTIWDYSCANFADIIGGKVASVRVEIRDGESYLFYKV